MTEHESLETSRSTAHGRRARPEARHPRADAAGADPVGSRVQKLSTASANRVIDPDESIPGHIGPGQVLPDDLLTISGLDVDLTPEQRIKLSREETASIVQSGIMFEAVLEAGLALEVTRSADLTDPRVTYLLHEIGEETRHQRLFIRMLTDLAPTARNLLDKPLLRIGERIGTAFIIQNRALLFTLILGGEEIPDLFQKLAGEHPDTDPFVQAVNRYHRQEEARHLSFARALLPEVWAGASRFDRFLVKRVAPRIILGMFDLIVQPGVYETVGLPGWKTWDAVRRTPKRMALRHEATRPVLDALIAAGAIRPGRVNGLWRSLCGVDAQGRPVALAA